MTEGPFTCGHCNKQFTLEHPVQFLTVPVGCPECGHTTLISRERALRDEFAIDYAMEHGGLLSLQTEQLEDSRNDLSVDEAREALRKNKGMVWIEPNDDAPPGG